MHLTHSVCQIFEVPGLTVNLSKPQFIDPNTENKIFEIYVIPAAGLPNRVTDRMPILSSPEKAGV